MVVAYFQVLPKKRNGAKSWNPLYSRSPCPPKYEAWQPPHCTAVVVSTDAVRSDTHQLRPAGSHLSEFRSACNRCILLRIWKKSRHKKISATRQRFLICFSVYLHSFSFLLFRLAFSVCLSVVYNVRHAGLGPKTGFPNRFFVFFSAVPRRGNHSICM